MEDLLSGRIKKPVLREQLGGAVSRQVGGNLQDDASMGESCLLHLKDLLAWNNGRMNLSTQLPVKASRRRFGESNLLGKLGRQDMIILSTTGGASLSRQEAMLSWEIKIKAAPPTPSSMRGASLSKQEAISHPIKARRNHSHKQAGPLFKQAGA
ncbi:unnamed protein product [Linum trigynum]|uniref:Uncharacterized protein n=1 Tax=Linum trigynum TaxID=586398 RepID=A0AAV2CU71_9ROSI